MSDISLITIYAIGYIRTEAASRYFWPLWLFLWSALNALFLAGDIFNLYVTLELLGRERTLGRLNRAIDYVGERAQAAAANARVVALAELAQVASDAVAKRKAASDANAALWTTGLKLWPIGSATTPYTPVSELTRS